MGEPATAGPSGMSCQGEPSESLAPPCDWKAFRESIEGLLESHFRQQERFIRQQLERLVAQSPRGPGADLAKKDVPDEGWKLSMEATVKRIEALLEQQTEHHPGHADHSFQRNTSLGSSEEPSEKPSDVQVAAVRLSTDANVPTDQVSDLGPSPRGPAAGGPGSGPPLQFQDSYHPDAAPAPTEGGSLETSPRASANSAPAERARFRRASTVTLERVDSLQKVKWKMAMQDRANLRQVNEQKHGPSALRDQLDTKLYEFLDWWMSLEEPPRKGLLPGLILTKRFDAFCAAVIIANACYTTYTTNYEVRHMAEDPMADIVECSFLAFYLVELMLKFCVHRLYFFCNDDMKFNLLDLGLVLVSIHYQLMIWIFESSGANLTFMRMLRILKVARILRVIRVVKVFTELRLMLNSILGSFQSLFWAFVMLTFVFYMFSLVFVQGTTTYLMQVGDEIDPASKAMVLRTYGSVERAMLSLYKAATGGVDWEDIFDEPLIEEMGPMNIGLFIFLIAFIQVALLNILTAVFVENALKLAQPDRDQQALEQRKKDMFEAQELRALCKTMDYDKSGTVDAEEFSENFQNGQMRATLQVLGLHIKDADLFYQMLLEYRAGKELTIDEFVNGCIAFRGRATTLDLQTVLHHVRIQNTRMQQFFQACDLRFDELSHRIAARPAASPWSSPKCSHLWHGERPQEATALQDVHSPDGGSDSAACSAFV